jgi:hypothetical protein
MTESSAVEYEMHWKEKWEDSSAWTLERRRASGHGITRDMRKKMRGTKMIVERGDGDHRPEMWGKEMEG